MFNNNHDWNEQRKLDGRFLFFMLAGSLLLGLASFMAFTSMSTSQVEVSSGKGLLLAAEGGGDGLTAVYLSAALQTADSDTFKVYILVSLAFFVAATFGIIFAKASKRNQEDNSRL